MKASTGIVLFLSTLLQYGKIIILAAATTEQTGVKVAEVGEQHDVYTGGEREKTKRELVSLAEKWSIGEPTFEMIGLDIGLKYPLSTFVHQDMVYYEVYDANCQEGGNLVSKASISQDPIVDVAPGSVTDPDAFSINGKTARVAIAIESGTIASDPEIYSETSSSSSNAKEATVAFCVRFGLRTLGESPSYELNFLETIVTVTIDLSGGFSIADARVAPKNRVVETATRSYGVTGYLCEEKSGTPLGTQESSAILSQGSSITICVRPDDDAIEDGLLMKSIDSFEWTKGLVVQEAIESGSASENNLTTFDPKACNGKEFCQLTSILFASFYGSEGQVSGSGVASMQFDSSFRRKSRRRLGQRQATDEDESLQHQDRSLQQQPASKFGVSFSVRTGADQRPQLAQSRPDAAKGAISGKIMALLASGLVAVAVLSMVAIRILESRPTESKPNRKDPKGGNL